MKENTEIISRDDGFYEIKLLYSKDKVMDLIKDNWNSRDNLAHMVTTKLAERFVHERYSELAGLIDMDLVKLLATRKLAGIVAKDEV